jgi:hypothetical protein
MRVELSFALPAVGSGDDEIGCHHLSVGLGAEHQGEGKS